ncbi:unnamed protein product, partial [Prorocentrum cordatum]
RPWLLLQCPQRWPASMSDCSTSTRSASGCSSTPSCSAWRGSFPRAGASDRIRRGAAISGTPRASRACGRTRTTTSTAPSSASIRKGRRAGAPRRG